MLEMVGFGERVPLVKNSSAANKQMNRRVEIIVYAADRPLGTAALEHIGAGLGEYRGSPHDFGKTMRAIRPVAAGGKSAPAEFFQHSCVITTGP